MLLLHCLSIVFLAAHASHASDERSPTTAEEGALVESIRRAEYHFGFVAGESGVWSAPNRAQGLRSRVSARGLEVFPRATGADGEGAAWKLALRTARFGRVDGEFELVPATVGVADERVELDHGHLVEWLVNREDGIEQGWTIPARPMGAGDLSIGLELAGDLSLRIEDGERSGMLVDSCGEAVLRYRDLHVFDASGRELAARLVPTPAGVSIEIDDAGGSYPLTVDPLLTGPAWTMESNQESAFLGASVSTAGDVNGDGYSDVIVSATGYDNPSGPTANGRVFAFHGSPDGLSATPAWEKWHRARIAVTAGDVNGDGYSDVLLGLNSRAYVYHGSASGLATTLAWQSMAALDSHFVASAGDVNGDGYSDVITGADLESNGEINEGRAFVYHGSPTGLNPGFSWAAESNLADARFGRCVSSAGDVNGDGYSDVIVGAYRYDNGAAETGRAYVYHGSATGLAWSPAWVINGSHASALLGLSVSCAGDVNGDGYSDVIVGAGCEGMIPNPAGRAFVYHGSASGLGATAAASLASDQLSGWFGSSVSGAGDVNGDGYSDVLVGDPAYYSTFALGGRVFLFLGGASGVDANIAWTADAYQQFSGEASRPISTAGDVNGDGYADVIVGSLFHENGEAHEGRASVYHGSPSGLASSSAWNAESGQGGALYGATVSTAGDVNGDGYSDVIVGAYRYDNGETDEGRAFVYHGSASGTAASPAWSAESDQTSAYFGVSVATAGDVNADGYSDVIVGAFYYDNVEVDEGRAYVYHGSPTGVSASPAWIAESDQTAANLGDSVASAGDVNGDGYSDVIVGVPGFDNGHVDEGRAHVYLGSASGLVASPSWTAESDQDGALFGEAVSTAGDVNADGYSDVIIGASSLDNGQANEGRAYVYHGSASGLVASPSWTAESDQADARFGYSVSSAGDVNGDGHSDVIVGAYAYDNGEVDEGRAHAFHGSPSGLSASPAWTAESDQAGAFFGFSASTAGDVNGDGYSDAIVGAVFFDNGQIDEGRTYAYLGSASGLATSPGWTAEPNQGNSILGNSAATAGDVNGDGYSDVIIGAPYHDNGDGHAWIHLGNEGHGLVRALQQRTRNGAGPLAVLGLTGESGLFRIRCEFAKNTAGTAWATGETPEAWLEWEVKPLGVPFDGVGIRRGARQSLLPAGGTVTLDELASIDDAVGHPRSTQARNYRWRARVATSSPIFPNTAWFGVAGNGLAEAKLRAPGLERHWRR